MHRLYNSITISMKTLLKQSAQDRQHRTGSTVQAPQDRHHRTGSTGQAPQDRHHRTSNYKSLET